MKLPLVFAGLCFFGSNRKDRRDLESGTDGLVEKSPGRTEEDAAERSTDGRSDEGRFGDDDDNLNESDSESVVDGDNIHVENLNENKRKEREWPAPSNASSPPRTTLYARFRRRLSSIKAFILQTDGDDDEDAEHAPNHRILPILSGIVIPFSILLEIPGLTGHWYVITEQNKTVESRKNSALLDVGLSISMACALLANIAIISRFLEKKVRTATLVAIIALSIHDTINIIAVTIFGVIHRFNDGFTYGQSFWFTLCSTIASLITNITLIIDYVQTPDFAHASSGLTRKQRSLVIVVMLLLCWIALGGLVNSLLMGLSFIDGMYFTVVVIETIGFGDIVPRSPGARAFCALHAAVGILNLALTVSICNDTIIESFQASYRKHLNAFDERRKAHRERKRGRHVEKLAMERQLARAGLPVYVHRVGHSGGSRIALNRKHLNVDALTAHQKEAAMQEARDILRLEAENSERKSTFSSQMSFDVSITEGLQKEFTVKLTVVWTLFLTFWLIGAAIFMATEGWSYGEAMWFCFEAFSTIGFGDQTPDTPAGRSVFIVWALLGVGTMTILISVLSEAYSSRYRKAIQAHAVRAVEHADDAVDTVLHKDRDKGKDKGRMPLLRRHSGHGRGRIHNLHRRHKSCPDMSHGWARGGTLSSVSRDEPRSAELDRLRMWQDAVRSLKDDARVDRVDFARTASPAP